MPMRVSSTIRTHPHWHLCRNQEVDDFLNYSYLIRTHWRIHQPAIDTYQGMGSLLYLHLAGTVRMHTLMIQELSLYKKINTLEKLGHLWMIGQMGERSMKFW